MNKKLNVEAIKTSAESPFSNGMVKSYLILAEIFLKTLNDVKCKPELALANVEF